MTDLRNEREEKALEVIAQHEKWAQGQVAKPGYPPDTATTDTLNPYLTECFNVIRQADRARHAIGRGDAAGAFLAGFSLEKAVGTWAVLALHETDGIRKGGRSTKMQHAVAPGVQRKMIEKCKELRARRPGMSVTQTLEQVAAELEISPKTVRKYLPKDLLRK
jgi:hypothetical protein